MNLNDPARRRALAACLAMPYTGHPPLIEVEKDLIRVRHTDLFAGDWKKAAAK